VDLDERPQEAATDAKPAEPPVEQQQAGREPGEAVAGREPGVRRGSGRNLPIAIAVGLAMGALVVLTLYTVKATFMLYMGAAVAFGGLELSRALAVRKIQLPLAPLAAGCAAVWTCAYWLGARAALAATALTVGALIIWRLPGGPAGYLRDVTASVFALAYLPLLAVFAVLILASRDGADRTIVFVAVTICSDVGGYVAGSTLGRRPLVPAISPKKTWEGLGGSVVLCVAAGAGLVPALLGGQFWQGMILGAAAVAAATLGDLAESMIKRDLEIKDMGSVLPGHGGLLERLDSLVFNAPVAWLLLAVFLPAGAR
jgi:phosphatidate cytidylyltransferase